MIYKGVVEILSMIFTIHLVVFSRRSILAYSLGECILEKMYVPPIEIQGAFNKSIKSNMGPVPADEMDIIESPKISFAEF